MNIISVLQKHSNAEDYKSEVLLIRDDDGIFKIMKEKIFYPPASGYLNEDVVLMHLSDLPFIPKFYGISKTNNGEYLRKSFMYGQPLSDYCLGNYLLSTMDAFFVIADIARKLKRLEDNNILLFDLKPDNLILSNEISFIDLGLCRYKDNDDPFIGVISHPRFSAPEIQVRASSKSIIFQLGLIAHELLYGYHPADELAEEHRMDWEYCRVKYFDPLTRKTFLDVKGSFLAQMLSYKTEERPSLEECSSFFDPGLKTVFFNRLYRKFRPNTKTVLFPARMGIPHYGHIEYMSRLMDLGYKLMISIQRSYTLTDRDPIPKWLVAKMVAQSLFDKGYTKDCFEIFLTPFYENDTATKLHFSTFPYKFDEVASSNPSISELFPSYHIIEQKDVLGHEDIDYEVLSWGEILRGAVKNNNYPLFKNYAASGVESILSFEEIREIYPKEDILFVYKTGSVSVQLLEDNKRVLLRNVYRFSNPESCLDQNVRNKYSKHPIISYNDMDIEIEYDKAFYYDDKLRISYNIKSKTLQKESATCHGKNTSNHLQMPLENPSRMSLQR